MLSEKQNIVQFPECSSYSKSLRTRTSAVDPGKAGVAFAENTGIVRAADSVPAVDARRTRIEFHCNVNNREDDAS